MQPVERRIGMRAAWAPRLVLAAALSVASHCAQAALKVGDAAPDFTLPAEIGGKDFSFSLGEELKKGPVVLYFYPKSFTRGCTIEAHEFADHYEDFASAGAAILGVSSDTIEAQRDFSSKECRDKFPVGADPALSTIKAYDAQREKRGASGEALADRISYVIADGKVVFALVDSNPVKHVESTLEFVRRWREEHKR
jgi:peroxiredoxin Q/BCP